MSFAAQESALLDLLFDRTLRESFRESGPQVLATRGLTEAECADFATVRVEALEMDARARVNFILAQYCRSYPLSFSLISSLSQGLDFLRHLVDASLIRLPPNERIAAFGIRLRDRLTEAGDAGGANAQALLGSIVEAELGMAWTAQLARADALANLAASRTDNAAASLPPDWMNRPLALAPLTSAAVLPKPYADLKAALCPCTGAELWRYLGKTPLPEATRRAVLVPSDVRLLVARAVVARASVCEPVVEHVTAELGEGFARLLPHVDGQHSVASLLAELRAAGAPDTLLSGVVSAFKTLGREGMLQVVG
ncbi:MAG TPA: hypothetical protein VFM34_03795 [Moraxellaceae bacterium]|nr:hypothetical protein [Moraxellaceae bacterium]